MASWTLIRRNLVRRGPSILAVLAVAATVATFVGATGMAQGLRRSILTTAEPDNLMLTRIGSRTETMSVITHDELAALRSLEGMPPTVSPELDDQVFFDRFDGTSANLVVRGVLPAALDVHRIVRISEGRMVRHPGAGEVMVGRKLPPHFKDLQLGNTFTFGRHRWTVVGVFEANDSSLESEVWVDLEDLFRDTRSPFYNCLSLKCPPGVPPADFARRIAADPRLANILPLPEPEYFPGQLGVADQLSVLGALAVLVLAIAAVFALRWDAARTIQRRAAEIRTLYALGFGQPTIAGSLVGEACLRALLGGAAGALLGLAVDGRTVSYASFMTYSTLLFDVYVSPALLAQGLLLPLLLLVPTAVLIVRRIARALPAVCARPLPVFSPAT